MATTALEPAASMTETPQTIPWIGYTIDRDASASEPTKFETKILSMI